MDDDSRRRYARHLMLTDIGEAGQEKIMAASVLVVGAGGLGAATISYLAASGVGRIGIIDHDHVELSNLQRQIIYEQGDIGRLKIEAAADRISELNPAIEVDVYPTRFSKGNRSIVSRYDIVADGCDSFETRFAVNDACVVHKKPLVSAAIQQFEGQLSVFAPHLAGDAPCYQCFVPEIPADANRCRDVGVISPLCGIIGSMQALEVLKLIAGFGTPLIGQILRYDARTHQLRHSTIKRATHCPSCGT